MSSRYPALFAFTVDGAGFDAYLVDARSPHYRHDTCGTSVTMHIVDQLGAAIEETRK